jgi:hypothetical protein
MAGTASGTLGRDFSVIPLLVTRATKIIQFPLVLQIAVTAGDKRKVSNSFRTEVTNRFSVDSELSEGRRNSSRLL